VFEYLFVCAHTYLPMAHEHAHVHLQGVRDHEERGAGIARDVHIFIPFTYLPWHRYRQWHWDWPTHTSTHALPSIVAQPPEECPAPRGAPCLPTPVLRVCVRAHACVCMCVCVCVCVCACVCACVCDYEVPIQRLLHTRCPYTQGWDPHCHTSRCLGLCCTHTYTHKPQEQRSSTKDAVTAAHYSRRAQYYSV